MKAQRAAFSREALAVMVDRKAPEPPVSAPTQMNLAEVFDWPIPPDADERVEERRVRAADIPAAVGVVGCECPSCGADLSAIMAAVTAQLLLG